MRSLSTPLLFASALFASAQPVLEYGNVHLLGNTFPIHVVTDPGTSDPNADGANVTWDFSSATLQMNAGTAAFVDPGTTPYAASYPTSNVAQAVTIAGTTFYNYFDLTATQLNMLAQEVGGPNERVYTDPKTPLEFPLSYPNFFIDYYAYDGDNYSVSRAYMGYGTVILPTGTYTNVVKVASTSGSIDFFRSNPVEHLVNINDDGFILVFGDAMVGVAETANLPALSAVPNPTEDVVSVHGLAAGCTWELFDAQGRVQRDGRHGTGVLTLDLAGLAPGAYSLMSRDAVSSRSLRIVKR